MCTQTNIHTLLYTHTNMKPEGNGEKAAGTAVSLLPGEESHFRNYVNKQVC